MGPLVSHMSTSFVIDHLTADSVVKLQCGRAVPILGSSSFRFTTNAFPSAFGVISNTYSVFPSDKGINILPVVFGT
jgi:hypothetical protein